jgi:hypothetical protein
MCGLVAAISKQVNGFKYADKSVFGQMLYADALRGFDSTGVYGVNRYGNLRAHKAAQKAGPFIDTKTYQDFADDIFSDFQFVVGHNRAATKGAKTDDNAHPFVEEHICLVHNGTLHTHRHLANVEVDSHAITKAIAERGYQEVIPDINGAYALIWYDAKEKKLFITRNIERPLHLVESQDAFYIASEAEMLEWILARNNIKHDGIRYFDTKLIYKWDLGKPQTYSTEDKPVKKVYPVVVRGEAQPEKKVTSPGSTTSTASSSCGLKHYKIGEVVTFTNECTEYGNGNDPILVGKTFDQYEVTVRCPIPKIVKTDTFEKLMESSLLDGIVTHQYYKLNECILVVKNPSVADVLVAMNQTVFTTAQFFEQGECCTKCGQAVSEADVAGSVVKVKHDTITSLICPDCVAEYKQSVHPSWGERKNEATC